MPLEWAFGGCDSGTGVFCTEPLALDGVCKCVFVWCCVSVCVGICIYIGNPFVFKKSIEMGQSVCEDDGVEHVLAKMMDEWPGEGYDLARRNCCHFAEVINFFTDNIFFSLLSFSSVQCCHFAEVITYHIYCKSLFLIITCYFF